MPQKYVRIEGVATLLHHRGPTTLPEAPPRTDRGEAVVCLHDVGGNGAVFGPVLDGLAADHSPIALDLPGHARSGGLDSLGSVERMAAFGLSVTDKLGIDDPVLFGEGLGAAVALEAALLAPQRVRGLVLCGAGVTRPVPEPTLDQLLRVTQGKARREFDASGYSPKTGRPTYGRAFGEWIKTDPRVLLGDLRALDAWSAEGRLGAIACPALVVVGSDQDDESRAAAETLIAALPDGIGVEVDAAGRHPVIEQPEALCGAVSAFLSGLGSVEART